MVRRESKVVILFDPFLGALAESALKTLSTIRVKKRQAIMAIDDLLLGNLSFFA
jgi:hypothetical protein